MTPISPVLTDEFRFGEVIFGNTQEEYIPLPVLRSPAGVLMSRWKLTDEERKAIAQGADVLLSVWSSAHPPVRVEIGECDRDILEMATEMGLVE